MAIRAPDGANNVASHITQSTLSHYKGAERKWKLKCQGHARLPFLIYLQVFCFFAAINLDYNVWGHWCKVRHLFAPPVHQNPIIVISIAFLHMLRFHGMCIYQSYGWGVSVYTLICDDSSKYRFSKAGKLSDQNDCSYCWFLRVHYLCATYL